jgi:hypothetical protein
MIHLYTDCGLKLRLRRGSYKNQLPMLDETVVRKRVDLDSLRISSTDATEFSMPGACDWHLVGVLHNEAP